jgi:hypothetical protein
MLLEPVFERDDLAHLPQGFPMPPSASEEGEGAAKSHEPRVLGPALRELRRDRGQLSLRLFEGAVVLLPVASLERVALDARPDIPELDDGRVDAGPRAAGLEEIRRLGVQVVECAAQIGRSQSGASPSSSSRPCPPAASTA